MTPAIDPPDTLVGEWARVLAATLVERGVREIVLSPGSRSTPFVVALAARSELACIDVIDERSAAFLALGMARATDRPVGLLCTSGTAAAHWYPAVIEASLSAIPLLLMTADRPIELAACGAAQTIDQVKMFGDHVLHFADLGAPDASETALRGLRRTVAQAVAIATDSRSGPVHLDLRARKPLEPCEPGDDRGRALRARVEQVLATPATASARASVVPSTLEIEAVARALAAARRPLIVIGPLPAHAGSDGTCDAAVALAERCGAPVFAEAASQLRLRGRGKTVAVDAIDLALERLGDDEPDLLVQIGSTPTSSRIDRFIGGRPALHRIVLGARTWTDPHATARTMSFGDASATLDALARRMEGMSPALDLAWRDRMRGHDRRAWGAIEEELESGGFGEGTVARTLIAALPERASLTIGNSLPIRTLDRFVRLGAVRKVLSQRGANGIDGLVSGAIGASLGDQAPAALMLGDLSFQHDLGGLASAHLVRSPLAIVVVQNRGGRIFEQLPVARSHPEAMSHFVTPQALRIAHAAAAFDVAFAAVHDATALRSALDRALARPGVTVIEAIVPEQGARDAEARILAKVATGKTP